MYCKNVGKKERVARLVGGGLMILCGLAGLGATPVGIAIAAAGGFTMLTGLLRYCPACGMAGRKAIED